MRRVTAEEQERWRRQVADDRETAEALLASPAGAALIRYLEVRWRSRGLGATEAKTAYRVALRDAIEELKDIQKEGAHA